MMFSALGIVVFTIFLFTFYLAYCTLRVARDNGKLALAPGAVKTVCWTILVVAVLLDVIFNIVIGSIAFLELPEWKRITFTMRCKKHMTATGFRGRLARWVCEGWLNPFEAGHC
jgi:hypothetical protein